MVVAADAVQMAPSGLKRLEALFHEQIETGVHPGAALAVYRYGKLAVDLYGGTANKESGIPVAHDTMFVLYSSTKPLAAACIHILWERGKLDWDDRVASYWPEFANNGKGDVTVRHILTHRGGFPDTPAELSWDRWHDWGVVAKAMEAISPTYEPGKVIAYHPRNFGWVIGELVRRIDGRPIQQFFEEEIKSTLNMQDTFIGLPAALEGRVSTIFAMEDCDRSAMVTTYNRPEVHQVVQPAGGGIATARDLGLFYAALAGQGVLNGQRILKPETVTEVTQLQVEGMDHSLERQVSRTLGMVLADPRMGSNGVEPNRTFGHGGAGTSVGWADPDSGLGVAYITNGFRAEQSNAQRLAAISQAVRDACR